MKTWIISDTHCKHSELKIPSNIDMVIHAGDWAHTKSKLDNYLESKKFLNWMKGLHAKYKIIVSGNHNTAMEDVYRDDILRIMERLGIIYLEDSFTNIEGITFYGSPWTPEFGRDWAFNIPKEHSGSIYDLIDDRTEVLITHGPPYGILDLARSGNVIGDMTLRRRVFDLPKLKYHIFGHLHECGGMLKNIDGVTFINAAALNLNHTLTNNGIIIDL